MMDWVYIPPDDDDEPTLFEGEGLRPPGVRAQLTTGANDSSDEAEYYGDDVDEVLLAGEKAFAHLAERLRSGTEPVETHINGCALTETPAKRMARIRRELDELAADAAADNGDTALTLDVLRSQLAKLEGAPTNEVAFDQGATDAPTATNGGVKSPAHLCDLERRIAALERVVGPSASDGMRGRTVGELLASVRDKLALVDDDAVCERLTRDARQISEALSLGAGVGDAGSGLMQAGAVLARMDEWEHVAATLPTVVARLRSLKRVQDEAAGLVRTVDILAQRYDELRAASEDNGNLLKDVRQSMDANLEVMLGNVRALEDRLEKVTAQKLSQ